MAERTPPPDDGDDLDQPADEARDEEIGTDLADDPADDVDPDPEPDDEGDGADDEPSDDDPEPLRTEQPAGPRGDRQFGRLRAENRRLRDELAQQGRTPPPDQSRAIEDRRRREAEEDERIALSGDPVAISQHFAARATATLSERLGRSEFFMADNADQAAFERQVQRQPMLAGLEDEVERRLGIARSQGMNPQRIALAKIVLADRILQRSGGAKTRQQRKGAAKVQRQQARPASARNDVGGGQRRSEGQNTQAARAKRLDESGQL